MAEQKDPRDDVLDAVNAGLIIVGADRVIVGWNAWMVNASGLPAADACGKSLGTVFPGASGEVLESAAATAIDSGASTLLTHALHPSLLPLRTRGGGVLVHDVMVGALGDPSHRRCLVQVVDVTMSARRDRVLRERQNARYDALVESAPDAILTLDSSGVIRLANPAAVVQFGYSSQELMGQNAAALFEPDGPWGALWHQLNSGTAFVRSVELVVIRKDGASRYFELSASRWRDGSRAFVTAILRDVNDRRDAEAALREANQSLQHSSRELNEVARRKDEFLATLAHELRNPLAPLLNGLELIKLAGNDAATVEGSRTMMERQVKQMVRLIDGLMDVSRISRDVIELDKELVSLADIIGQAVETCRPFIDAQHHHLTVNLPAEEIRLDADSVRLIQVFANLLNNAAKYTPKGGHITLGANVQGGKVVVRVADTGIGIPSDMLPKVFDLFMQVDHSFERTQGGLGIGLSLVKRLVEMHAGSVQAHSHGLGKGSEFVVELPIAVHAAKDQAGIQKTPAGPVTRLRILVADDNEDTACSLAMLLKSMGHETKTVHDGRAALDVADGFLPQVVVLDIGMPSLNGYDTARRMRQKPWGKAAYLVALTGWGQEQDRQRSKDAGFNAHLVKPVAAIDLQRLFASTLSKGDLAP